MFDQCLNVTCIWKKNKRFYCIKNTFLNFLLLYFFKLPFGFWLPHNFFHILYITIYNRFYKKKLYVNLCLRTTRHKNPPDNTGLISKSQTLKPRHINLFSEGLVRISTQAVLHRNFSICLNIKGLRYCSKSVLGSDPIIDAYFLLLCSILGLLANTWARYPMDRFLQFAVQSTLPSGAC